MGKASKKLWSTVDQATISVVVLDFAAKLVMEAVLEAKTETDGSLSVTLKEGTWTAW